MIEELIEPLTPTIYSLKWLIKEDFSRVTSEVKRLKLNIVYYGLVRKKTLIINCIQNLEKKKTPYLHSKGLVFEDDLPKKKFSKKEEIQLADNKRLLEIIEYVFNKIDTLSEMRELIVPINLLSDTEKNLIDLFSAYYCGLNDIDYSFSNCITEGERYWIRCFVDPVPRELNLSEDEYKESFICNLMESFSRYKHDESSDELILFDKYHSGENLNEFEKRWFLSLCVPSHKTRHNNRTGRAETKCMPLNKMNAFQQYRYFIIQRILGGRLVMLEGNVISQYSLSKIKPDTYEEPTEYSIEEINAARVGLYNNMKKLIPL